MPGSDVWCLWWLRALVRQAWVPKVVVLLGLTLSQLSVLMLPLDRANRAACDTSIVLNACQLTLPMAQLWHAALVVS